MTKNPTTLLVDVCSWALQPMSSASSILLINHTAYEFRECRVTNEGSGISGMGRWEDDEWILIQETEFFLAVDTFSPKLS